MATRARAVLAEVDPRLRVIMSFAFAAAVVALDRPLPPVVAAAEGLARAAEIAPKANAVAPMGGKSCRRSARPRRRETRP